jgi:hypothetical protein
MPRTNPEQDPKNPNKLDPDDRKVHDRDLPADEEDIGEPVSRAVNDEDEEEIAEDELEELDDDDLELMEGR